MVSVSACFLDVDSSLKLLTGKLSVRSGAVQNASWLFKMDEKYMPGVQYVQSKSRSKNLSCSDSSTFLDVATTCQTLEVEWFAQVLALLAVNKS